MLETIGNACSSILNACDEVKWYVKENPYKTAMHVTLALVPGGLVTRAGYHACAYIGTELYDHVTKKSNESQNAEAASGIYKEALGREDIINYFRARVSEELLARTPNEIDGVNDGMKFLNTLATILSTEEDVINFLKPDGTETESEVFEIELNKFMTPYAEYVPRNQRKK